MEGDTEKPGENVKGTEPKSCEAKLGDNLPPSGRRYRWRIAPSPC